MAFNQFSVINEVKGILTQSYISSDCQDEIDESLELGSASDADSDF